MPYCYVINRERNSKIYMYIQYEHIRFDLFINKELTYIFSYYMRIYYLCIKIYIYIYTYNILYSPLHISLTIFSLKHSD